MPETALTKTLSDAEKTTLHRHEQTVSKGLSTFQDVGLALVQIRDLHLYRADYKSFEEYCQDKWDIERAHAYRLMGSAQVVENLKRLPLGDIEMPSCEKHARPLTVLPPEQQGEAWKEASKSKKVTEGIVQRIVDRFRSKTKSKSSPAKKDSDGWTKADLESDSELSQALDRIAAVYSDGARKSIQNGTIGLSRSDIIGLAALHASRMHELESLIMQLRWDVPRALKFLHSEPSEDVLEQLYNFALGTKSGYYTFENKRLQIQVKIRSR